MIRSEIMEFVEWDMGYGERSISKIEREYLLICKLNSSSSVSCNKGCLLGDGLAWGDVIILRREEMLLV